MRWDAGICAASGFQAGRLSCWAACSAAIGIWRSERAWGWNFGALLAAATLIGYIASRTVGLPQIPAEPDAWFEPLGVVSLVAEVGFLAVYGLALNRTVAVQRQIA